MQSHKVGVFFPAENSDFFLFHLKDIDAANSSVACFQIPYPYTEQFEQQIESACATYKHIVIIGCELHPVTVDFIRRFDRPNITYFLCGYLNVPLVHSTVHLYLDWFITTTDCYRNNLLDKLTPYSTKPYAFDALLGRRKPHRQLAWDYIQHYLKDQCIATYIDNHQIDFGTEDSNKWIWEREGLEVNEIPQWTVETVTYNNHQQRLSQIIPISIYNQSAYSLVAETNVDNDYVFFTEKTVKPILAKRLFIMLGNRYVLARLRDLGFKTFDSVIDESYDTIEPVTDRHCAALDQMRWLTTQDQSLILNQLQPIVEHNARHMLTTDWYKDFKNTFRQIFK